MLLFQVSYLDCSYCRVKSDNRFLIVVLCPSEWSVAFMNCDKFVKDLLCRILLLLSGDVESNPGPGADEVLATVLQTVQRIELGQDDIRNDLRALKNWQASVDVELRQLSARIRVLEVDTAALKNSSASPVQAPEVALEISDKLKSIESRCDDAENRLRRSNLLFFGLPDTSDETWSSAETKVINLCSETLGVTVEPSQIERAHRLGKYQEGKCRPVIVKFALFKDKQLVLEKGPKFKNTNYAVREDFSLKTRISRKHLLDFAKSQNATYKLSVDRLHIGDVTFVFDVASGSVIRSTR